VTVECLECGTPLIIPLDTDEGDTVTCKKCGEAFVIVALNPFEIDYADSDDEGEWNEEWLGDDDLEEEDEDW
jgi:hypothetical protein